MIDGVTSRPFLAQTLSPFERPEVSFREKIIELSREKYASQRAKVEEKIAKEWLGEEEELYTARCWVCGKEIEVPFEPEPGRPVYCKECMKKIREGKIEPPRAPLYEAPSVKDEGFVGLDELKKEKAEKKEEPKKKTVSPDLEDLRKALRQSLQKKKD